MHKDTSDFFQSLFAGGAAGFSVDVALYPLDTLKTRLQSSVGFRQAGGFRHIYSGLGAAALGSAPNAAVFFCTYETAKKWMIKRDPNGYEFIHHALCASLGEVMACLIRVPAEVVKQRRQAGISSSSLKIFKDCFKEGIFGPYRGYWSTLLREIPFSFIQYPLWELFKKKVVNSHGKIESWQSAACGAMAGGIAAAMTTPLDVAKTRIMLAKQGSKQAQGKVLYVIIQVYSTKGVQGLFAGMVPRSLWMSLGGFIYFGVYELSRELFQEFI